MSANTKRDEALAAIFSSARVIPVLTVERVADAVPLARALVAGDVGALFRLGANGFLMAYLARFEVCGLNVASYNERMRAVKVDEIGQPVG